MLKKIYLILLLLNGLVLTVTAKTNNISEDSIQKNVLQPINNYDQALTDNTTLDSRKPWFSIPYPNPIKDFVTLDYYLPENNNSAQIRISDLTGKTLKIFNLQSFDKKIRINMSSFNRGMYFLSIYYNGNLIKSNALILGAK